MAHGGPIQSPYVYESADNAEKFITITVTFNNATRALTGGTLHRDAGCVYTKIFLGLGPDGTPETSPKKFDVSGLAGNRSVTAGQLAAAGYSTIEDILALGQITAGT